MCESFERLADKVAEERAEQRAEQTTVNNIRLIMKNLKCSLEEALNTLEITGKDRAILSYSVPEFAICFRRKLPRRKRCFPLFPRFSFPYMHGVCRNSGRADIHTRDRDRIRCFHV